MRYEHWKNLYGELCVRPHLRPAGWEPSNKFGGSTWGYIISATRSCFLAGPRADWWRDRETILDRARQHRPGKSGDKLAPPVFPSFHGARVIPEIASQAGASSSTQAIADAPRNDRPRPRNKNNGKPKPKPAPAPSQQGPCHYCGKMGHLKKDCRKRLHDERMRANNNQNGGKQQQGSGGRKKTRNDKTKQSKK